jgi:sugar lactone lactonase YvrE
MRTRTGARIHLLPAATAAALWLAAVATPVLAVTYYATYKLNGGTATQSNQTYSATATDTSAVWATSSGRLILNNCTIATSGNSSSVDTSSQYGLNAGVLADSKGMIIMSGGSVTTTGSGANGLFATGAGAAISFSNGTIKTTGSGAHGVDATYSGAIALNNVTISTAADGASAGLSTDFGGGTVTATGVTVTTAGTKSPTIYSTGVITVTGSTLKATGGDGGVIDGANSIILSDTSLQGKACGIKVHRTAKSSGSATITITGGSLTATAGDAFLFAAESGSQSAAVTVKSTAISASSGCLIDATSGSAVTFTADTETLAGSFFADSTSSITAALKSGTAWIGTATNAALTLDSTSAWTIPAASTLTKLTTAGTICFNSPAKLITVSGAASLGGTLIVQAIPAVGTYVLIQAGSVSGTFSRLALPPGVTGSLSYSSTAVTLTITSVAPAEALSAPSGIAIDASGVLYVADANDHVIAGITRDGVVTTLAGTADSAGSTDANGADARFNRPAGLALDASGNLYAADSNNSTIRRITPAGVVTTLAGMARHVGALDANGMEARFNHPAGLAVNASGSVYVADTNNGSIRMITSDGRVTTLYPTNISGAAVPFSHPTSIAVDANENLYVADANENAIFKVTTAGVATQLAGAAAGLNQPGGLALDALGSVYVANTGNDAILKITAQGVVTTFAGLPTMAGLQDGAGIAALFNKPQALAFDASGTLYVADTGNSAIRKVSPEGVVSTLPLTCLAAK